MGPGPRAIGFALVLVGGLGAGWIAVWVGVGIMLVADSRWYHDLVERLSR